MSPTAKRRKQCGRIGFLWNARATPGAFESKGCSHRSHGRKVGKVFMRFRECADSQNSRDTQPNFQPFSLNRPNTLLTLPPCGRCPDPNRGWDERSGAMEGLAARATVRFLIFPWQIHESMLY